MANEAPDVLKSLDERGIKINPGDRTTFCEAVAARRFPFQIIHRNTVAFGHAVMEIGQPVQVTYQTTSRQQRAPLWVLPWGEAEAAAAGLKLGRRMHAMTMFTSHGFMQAEIGDFCWIDTQAARRGGAPTRPVRLTVVNEKQYSELQPGAVAAA